MLEVSNRNKDIEPEICSMASLMIALNIIRIFFSVSIVDLRQVNVC